MLQLSNDSLTCSPVAEVWALRRLKWSQTDIVHGMGERARSKTLRNELQNMVMSSLGRCCGRYNCSSSDQGMSLLIAVPCRQQGIAPNTVTSVSAILRLLHIDTRQHLTTWKMSILKYKQQKENETKSQPINRNLPFLFFVSMQNKYVRILQAVGQLWPPLLSFCVETRPWNFPSAPSAPFHWKRSSPERSQIHTHLQIMYVKYTIISPDTHTHTQMLAPAASWHHIKGVISTLVVCKSMLASANQIATSAQTDTPFARLRGNDQHADRIYTLQLKCWHQVDWSSWWAAEMQQRGRRQGE